MKRVSILLLALSIDAFVYGMACRAQVRNNDIVSMYIYNGQDERTYKQKLNELTSLTVERVGKVVSIDESQLRKLKLAANGDLNRFYREIEIVREKTKGLNIQDQNDMQKAWTEVMPLRQRAEKGLLDVDSLFEKVLRSVLDREQSKRYADFQRTQEINRYKAILRVTITDMDKYLPLTSDQRVELLQLVESKGFPREVRGQMQAYVGGVMLSRLTDQETTQILDEQQQKVFVRLKEQYAMHAGNVQW